MNLITSPLKVFCRKGILCLGLVFFSIFLIYPAQSFAETLKYTCTLPYNNDVEPQTAQIVAKSFAYIQALIEVEKEFKNNKAISIGLKDTSLRKAVAAELYAVNVKSEPEDFTTPSGDVHVTVEISLPEHTTGQNISKLLENVSLLEMKLELINLLSELSKQGQKIILIRSNIQKNAHNLSPQALNAELENISQRLQALWLYDEALNSFKETWNNPSLIQTKLLKATKLAPGIAALWAALGEVQLQLDQPQNALKSLNNALNLQPDRARAFYARGLGHLRLQQPTLAKADLDTALKYQPHMATWLNARGAIFLVLEDYANMCEDFEQACGLGNCEGLAHARKRDLCLQ